MRSPELIVLRQTGLGDLLSGLPALRGIRRQFPHHQIRMTCPSWLVPLAEQLALADDLITEDAGSGDPVDHEGADASMLRAALGGPLPPDVVVALRVPERSVAEALVERRARVLVAYRHAEVEETSSFPGFSFSDHILVRWERLLDSFGISTRRAELHFDTGEDRPYARKGHTLIHIGAGSPARRWPAERWSDVARSLEARGHRVILTGTADEVALVARVRHDAGLPPDRDLSAQTDVLAVADLVEGAKLVLSCDTGIAHLAIGLRRPSVILFGAVPPTWWGPPPGCPLHRSLWKGRLGEPYAPQPDAGLLEISVEEVLHAALTTDWPNCGRAAGDAYSCPFLTESGRTP